MGGELIVIGAAFLLTGLLARAGGRVGLPTIPLFVIAGILVGPNTRGPVLFHHPDDLELLAAFGLIFLLFHLGAELSVEQLTRGGRSLLASAGIYLALNLGGGLALGLAFGWGGREALVIAGATGISSSAIVSKLLVELRRLDAPETPLLLGIIVIEDLFLALYLAALAPVLGSAEGAAEAAVLFARALAFLLAMAALARWGGAVVTKLVSAESDELLVVSFVGFALVVAGAAAELGVSDAIGAFMAGLAIAGTAVAARVERLVRPLRDAFAALFFFAFGLAIDPGQIAEVALPAAVAVAVTLVLATVGALIAAWLNGLDATSAAAMGTALAARGEFALILVTLAGDAHLDPRVAPFVAAYVLVLAIVSPVLSTHAAAIGRRVPRQLVRSAP